MKILIKGSANIPQRFWRLAFCKTEEEVEKYTKEGFYYSEKETKKFNDLDEESKAKLIKKWENL